MFEEVKNLKLPQSHPYVKRTKSNLIVLHHFGNDATVESVARYHISEGHAGIDYNVVVYLNGDVVWGRGLEYEGGHTMNKSGLPTYGVNARSIGIAFQGNFMTEHMGAAQLAAGKKIIQEIAQYYKITNVDQIVMHREIAGANYTDCPGVNFPAEDFRAFLNAVQAPAEPKFKVFSLIKKGASGAVVQAIQKALNAHCANPQLATDGIFGDKTLTAVKAFQKQSGLSADGVVGKQTTAALGGVWTGK